MWSNSSGVQAKCLPEQQKQFDELLSALEIPLSLSSREKLKLLREIPSKAIVEAQRKMKITEFRATSDNAFISMHSIEHINSGDFARRMKSRGITLMNGECRDEHNLYRTWRTTSNSYDGVFVRLCADYPEVIVTKLMKHYCGPSKALPSNMKDWPDLFGYAYANLQVHYLERGFHDKLVRGGLEPGKDLLRYRIEWRADCCGYPPEWGVTHATDMAIWFWYPGLSIGDKRILKPWNEAFANFVKGNDAAWGTKDVMDMKRLRSDGQTEIWKDDRWEEGLYFWKLLNEEDGETKARL
jgi:carboxylesterase type B